MGSGYAPRGMEDDRFSVNASFSYQHSPAVGLLRSLSCLLNPGDWALLLIVQSLASAVVCRGPDMQQMPPPGGGHAKLLGQQ